MRARINGAAWFLDGCVWCHKLTTSAREPLLTEYRNAGLLLVEGQDARLVPVQTRHAAGKVLLDDDGTWRLVT
jgi:hypothetical protein